MKARQLARENPALEVRIGRAGGRLGRRVAKGRGGSRRQCNAASVVAAAGGRRLGRLSFCSPAPPRLQGSMIKMRLIAGPLQEVPRVNLEGVNELIASTEEPGLDDV